MAQRLSNGTSSRAGYASFQSLGLSAGWCTTPDMDADFQPTWNNTRTACIVFFGQEFSALPSEQSKEADATIARHALRLYDACGPAFVGRLNGYFCGFLIDVRAEKAFLFNDPHGLSRLYYHESTEGLWVSSQAKSLLGVSPKLRQLDQRGLAEFFSVGCVLQNRSLFKGISLLPPGSIWTLQRGGTVGKRQYIDPNGLEQLAPLSPAEYGEKLLQTFSRLVPRYAQDTRGVAMSLTGGLDSRMILASLSPPPGSLPCYTFGGSYRDCADVTIAQELARVARQPHTTIRVGSKFLNDFSTLAERTIWLSDGTMDVSGAVELYVNDLARQLAPIRLTGNYGSEILRANVAFRPRSCDLSLFTPQFREHLIAAANTYHEETAGHRLSFIAFKQVPWHHHARFSIERSRLIPRSPFLDKEVVELAYQTPPSLKYSASPSLELIARSNPELAQIGTDRALRSGHPTFGSRLANRWQEFTAKAEYAYDYGMPQWLARADQVLRPLRLERLFLGRHKFYHFRVWYRDELKEALLAEIGSSEPSECYADGAAKRLVQEHLSGRFNRTLELHQLLTLKLIDRLLLASPCRN